VSDRRRDNLGYWCHFAAKAHAGRVAMIDLSTREPREVTYRELEERLDRCAAMLTAAGLKPGDTLAMAIGNRFEFVEVMYGAMRAGIVPVPLNTRLGADTIAYILENSECRGAVIDAAQSGNAAGACDAAGLAVKLAFAPAPAGWRDYESALQAAPAKFEPPALAPDHLSFLPYTSGSTGKPKGVPLTHGGQLWWIRCLQKYWPSDPDSRALAAVPLYHKNAMAGAVKPFLLAGGSLVILPGFDALEVIRAIDRYKVTYLTGVPAMYKMILAEKDALARHDVSSVRYAVCGSAEVPEELLDEFRRVFGAPIGESYGLTEGGPVPIVNSRWGLKKRNSCGLAFPGCDLRLVDESDRDVGVDEVGELVTRNPGLAKGYWKLPEATAKKFRGGWLYTGDLMRRDADGYFYFVGRRDDMINVAGENVYPKEVEDILLQHPNLRDACVVPAPHDVKGEVPIAFVVAREAGATTEDDVRRFFLERGAPYAHPRKVIFLEALPLGGTGKIDRTDLKARAREIGL
jgi:acyl-CoA synthetase (AMP-forming)/AMP-acid ligase II